MPTIAVKKHRRSRNPHKGMPFGKDILHFKDSKSIKKFHKKRAKKKIDADQRFDPQGMHEIRTKEKEINMGRSHIKGMKRLFKGKSLLGK